MSEPKKRSGASMNTDNDKMLDEIRANLKPERKVVDEADPFKRVEVDISDVNVRGLLLHGKISFQFHFREGASDPPR